MGTKLDADGMLCGDSHMNNTNIRSFDGVVLNQNSLDSPLIRKHF